MAGCSIDKHPPLITKKIKGHLCPSMSSEAKREMNLRDQLLRKDRRTNREIDWSSYKRQRNKVNSQIKKCKSNYYKDLFQDKASFPDKFWLAIKKLIPKDYMEGGGTGPIDSTQNVPSITQNWLAFKLVWTQTCSETL